MSWFGIVLIVVGAYLAFKLAGVVVKLAMWGLVLFGAWWLLAPHFGWSSPF